MTQQETNGRGSSDSAHYDRAIMLFASLQHADRATLTDMLSKEHPSVRDLLSRMLESDTGQTRALHEARSDLLDVAGDLLTSVEGAASRLPERIGPYVVTGILGEGGMGMVFDAREQHPDRRVAIKVLRGVGGLLSSSGTRELASRFEREVNVVGRLHHHGIAQVYQAGTFDSTGQRVPYFAMEFVDGPTLDRFIQTDKPSLESIVALLAKICDAMSYAHDQGVVHRDLKPRNIVVQRRAGSDEYWPKVLDFGVARVIDSDATLATGIGHVVGTLAYMSPEQLNGQADVDQRADVYSLGVMLCESLTGTLPYGRSPTSILDAANLAKQDRPRCLSQLRPGPWGDLDVIVQTALAQDKQRRYATAAALADDLRRYLRREPILARKPSAAYLFTSFARRNRALVGSVLAGVMGLAVLAGVALFQARAAERERAQAARQRDKAQAVTDFLVQDLFNTHRFALQGGKTPVMAMLQGADESARERFKDKPEVRYELEYRLASMYSQMGLWDKSLELLEHATQTVERVYPEGHSERRAIQSMYFGAMVDAGRGQEITKQLADATKHNDSIEGRWSITSMLLRLSSVRASLMSGDTPAAEALLDEMLDEDSPESIRTSDEYGQAINLRTAIYLGTERPREAMQYMQKMKDFTDQPAHFHGHNWLAVRMQEAIMHELMGNPQLALEASTPLVPIAKRLMLDSDVNLGIFIGNHANMLNIAGQHEEAKKYYLEAMDIFEETGDPIAWEATRIYMRFRDMLDRTNQWDDLETLLRRWLVHWERLRPPEDPGRVEANRSIAELLIRRGNVDQARPIVERCVALASAWPEGSFLHGRGAVDVTAGMLKVRDGDVRTGRELIERGRAVFLKERSLAFPFVLRISADELAKLDAGQTTK